MTHSHFDHYGNLKSFAEKYAENVTVEYFIYNSPADKYFITMKNSLDPFLSDAFPLLMRNFAGAKRVNPHAGQTLKIRDAEIEVLFNHELLFPKRIKYLNEISLVTRVKIAGQTLFFPADAEIQSDDIIERLYGNYLKSDFYQVPHHGYSGGNERIFDFVSPDFAMWTTSQQAFDICITDEWPRNTNRHIVRVIQPKKIFVADGGNKIIPLPYDGGEVSD